VTKLVTRGLRSCTENMRTAKQAPLDPSEHRTYNHSPPGSSRGAGKVVNRNSDGPALRQYDRSIGRKIEHRCVVFLGSEESRCSHSVCGAAQHVRCRCATAPVLNTMAYFIRGARERASDNSRVDPRLQALVQLEDADGAAATDPWIGRIVVDTVNDPQISTLERGVKIVR
jgi:hypothetical protein